MSDVFLSAWWKESKLRQEISRMLDHLKIVEKFGVCEEQGEEVVDVEAEVPGDDFSGVLALPPCLIGEYIRCRG